MTANLQWALRWRWMAAFILMWALTAPGASNSGWTVRTWQIGDGLPNNGVTGVSQAMDGYLWVATHNGLARFDGVQFQKFPLTNSAGLLSEDITLLQPDATGGFWMAFNRGPISHLSSGLAELVTNTVPQNPLVTAMVDDNEGGLLVAFNSSVVRIKNGRMKEFTAEDGIPDGACWALSKDTKGRIWLAKGTQVGLFENDHFKKLLELEATFLRMAACKSGGVWICSNNQLFTCSANGDSQKVGSFGGENSSIRPNIILEDRNGTVWIGTRRDGLYCYDGSGFQSVPTSHNTILCLTEDREGNIWAGTGGGGLNQVRSRIIQLEGAGTGLASQTIQSVSEDSQGRLWGLSQSGLILLRTNGAWELVSSNATWLNIGATCIAADQKGALWAGTTSRTLVRWQNGSFTFWGRNDGIKGSFFRKLLPVSTGDIWIGEGPPETLQCLHDGLLEAIALPPGFHHIRAMAEATEGNIIVGGDNGDLVRIWKEQGQYITQRIEGLHQPIRCVSATPDGSVWIGYENAGVGRFKNGHFALIGVDQGLYNDGISEIVDDGHGALWFGSDHGIFRVQISMLDAVAEQLMKHAQSIHYGNDEGLPAMRANPENAGGAARSRDGRLWMPMGASLAIINPDKVNNDSMPPTVLLTEIAVDGQAVASYGGDVTPEQSIIALEKPKRQLRLPPGHHRVDFAFTALNFTAPENVHFRYKLTGLDPDWSKENQERNASYSRLSPGDYQFLVMACNSSGVWNETGSSFAFTVLPFVWDTWWFRLTTIVAFTILILSVGRYFSYRKLQYRLIKLQQQAALDKERTRIARDLHDDLGGCLTQIVMVSGLHHRGRISNEKANDEVQAAVRYAISALDQTVWAINPRNDTVPVFINYTSQFVVGFLRSAGIKCDADIPDQLPEQTMSAEVRHNLFLVIKESVNNIVLHANATEVKIQVSISGDSLRFTIRDNGCGFARSSDDPNADGLRNMRQRMEELHGEFQIETTPGAGTCVVLDLPLST